MGRDEELDRGIDILRSANGKVVAAHRRRYNHRPSVVGQPWILGRRRSQHSIDHWNKLLRRSGNEARRRERPQLVDLNAHVSPNGEYTNTLDGVELRYDGVGTSTPMRPRRSSGGCCPSFRRRDH